MRKSAAFLLAAAMLISATACNDITIPADSGETSVVTEEAETSEQPATEDAPETAPTEEAPSTTAEATAKEPTEKIPHSLYDITLGQLRNLSLNLKERERYISDYYSMTFTDNMFALEDGSGLALDKETATVDVRDSTRIMRSGDTAEEEILSLVDAKEYKSGLYYDSGYTIEWKDPILKFSSDYSEGLKIKSFDVSYSAYSPQGLITTRGFIKLNDSDFAEFILDPAYTYGIPMLSSLPENMKFSINGSEMYADTLCFEADMSSEVLAALPEGNAYVYAEVTFNSFSVRYRYSDDEELRGYENSIYIRNIEVLTENTDSVIAGGFLFSDADKAPEMTDTYNAIINNLDTLYNKDTTIGMTFVDMDFDGTPELLVSDRTGETDFDRQGADVTVYRIKGSELVNVGVIPNTIFRYGMLANSIGLKTLEDGTKGWFVTTYKDLTTGDFSNDCDYLYTLEGDSLVTKELFRAVETSQGTNSDGGALYEYDYYFMGERMDITATPNPPPEDIDGLWFDTDYSWGGYTGFSEGMPYGLAREDFANDITETYNLCCDWLSEDRNFTPVTITERELIFNIANMVDCFYLGVYNPRYQNYYYSFLGAMAKPVIYLYPEETTEVSVSVDFRDGGEITVSYPDYGDGWNVTAHPDGTLFDESGNEYYCLYWEADARAALDLAKGFCVRGEDTAEFLREKLLHIGLTPREANEFIIYWLPLMQENEYNIISLHTEQYSDSVPLTVSPAPDSEIRVFMTYTPSDIFVDIPPQSLPSYERSGFTLVEWGGGEY